MAHLGSFFFWNFPTMKCQKTPDEDEFLEPELNQQEAADSAAVGGGLHVLPAVCEGSHQVLWLLPQCRVMLRRLTEGPQNTEGIQRFTENAPKKNYKIKSFHEAILKIIPVSNFSAVPQNGLVWLLTEGGKSMLSSQEWELANNRSVTRRRTASVELRLPGAGEQQLGRVHVKTDWE